MYPKGATELKDAPGLLCSQIWYHCVDKYLPFMNIEAGLANSLAKVFDFAFFHPYPLAALSRELAVFT